MIYVYCVTHDAVTPDVEGVDGSSRFGVASIDGVSAVFTAVDAEAFSQEAIDQRAGDLEWLGAIGYRHQAVVADLMKRTSIVPLRAFTLFSSEEALRAFLHEHAQSLKKTLERLDKTLATVERNVEGTADLRAESLKTVEEMNELMKSLPCGMAERASVVHTNSAPAMPV